MIEVVIDKLKEQRYLNDTNYAALYSSYRKDNEKFGAARVITDLRAKGVHADIIGKTVGAAYEGVNEEQLARDYLQRKRLHKPADRKQAARIFRVLARAGFGTGVIISVLKNWEVDEETLSVLETEAVEPPSGESSE
jgi:regulatory protein